MSGRVEPKDQAKPSTEDSLAHAVAMKFAQDYHGAASGPELYRDLAPLASFNNCQKAEFIQQVAHERPDAEDAALGFAHAHFDKDGSVVFNQPGASPPERFAQSQSGNRLSFERPQNDNLAPTLNPDVIKWTERLGEKAPVTDADIRSMSKLLYSADASSLSKSDRDNLISAIRSRVDNDTFLGKDANSGEELYLSALLPRPRSHGTA